MLRKHLSALLSVTTALLIFMGIAPVGIASAQESEPVEILSMRSEYEKHYDNGDGTITAFIDTVPLHYNADGEWIDIDNTLVLDESGNYVNKSNSMDVTLAPSASVSALNAVDDEQMVSVDYNGYSISWDFVNEHPDTAVDASIGDISMPISYASIDEEDSARNIDLGSNKLNKKASESVSKLTSSLSYDSLYENVDVDIDVMPSSVKETIILNDRDNVPEQFSYYIQSEGLTAELYDDNSVHFVNEYEEDIFNIPAPYMFDSADIPENNYDIKVNVQEYEKGYLLTFIPDSDWIQSSERIYPVMISPDIQTRVINAGIDYSYISEQAPSFNYSNNYLRVGNQNNSGYQSFVKVNNLFANSSRTISTIYSANFCLYVPPNSLTSDFYVDVYSVNSEQSDVCWNNSSGFDNNTYMSRFTITESSEYKQYSINMTKLTQYWLNNYNTGLIDVGIPNYGFKLATDSNSTMYLCCDSSSTYRPYFAMMYSLEPSFRIDYAPEKYNDFGKITNFQNRMNCYAYALQTYYKGEGGYSLLPGEFGLDNSDLTNSRVVLRYYYNSPYPYNFNDDLERQEFVEKRMREDAQVLNFNISEYFKSINGKFVLPSEYNPNEGRIIAMTTAMYFGVCEYHFYARNGNGTCPNGHGETCSMWSHKPALEGVTNKSFSNGTILCDENIAEYVGDANGKAYYSDDARYYIIDKDTDVYNSWHGKSVDSGSTPYQT